MRQTVAQRTVLVTGANGYVGNTVAKAFARAGWRDPWVIATRGGGRQPRAERNTAARQPQQWTGLDGLGEVNFVVVSNTEDQTDPSGYLAVMRVMLDKAGYGHHFGFHRTDALNAGLPRCWPAPAGATGKLT